MEARPLRTNAIRILEGIIQMASANDMQAAQKTYAGFITLLKFAIPVLVAIAAFVIVTISS
jgi:hypothetical protein